MRDCGKSSWLFIAPCKGKRILQPGILALESGIQLWESGSPLKIYWNSAPGIRNPRRGNQNPPLSWIPLLEASFTSMTDELNTAWDCNETPSANWSQWNLAQRLVPVKLLSTYRPRLKLLSSIVYLPSYACWEYHFGYSWLDLGVKIEECFISSSCIFLEKKALLKVWLDRVKAYHLLKNAAPVCSLANPRPALTLPPRYLLAYY